jgi:plastocyanin
VGICRFTISGRPCRAALYGLTLVIASGAGVQAAGTMVAMTNRETFTPATIHIHVGDVVTWKNTSSAVHTVTDDPKLAARPADASLPPGAKPFNSGFLKAGADYRHRFTVPGTYHYFCLLHEAAGMLGTVVVSR